MIPHHYFVTATDTDCGKTHIGCALLALARQRGLTTAGGKPIASGSEATAAGLRNSDAMMLKAQCVPELAYEAINPVALQPAIAPHIAAAEAGQAVTLEYLQDAMMALLTQGANGIPPDFAIIEGAGGWRVPINAEHDLADLAAALQLPVIVVVNVKLGALNHSRLTLEAIRHDGLPIAGWVANLADGYTAHHAQDTRLDANLASLRQWLDAPCLGVVPHLDEPTPEAMTNYLNIKPLLEESSADEYA